MRGHGARGQVLNLDGVVVPDAGGWLTGPVRNSQFGTWLRPSWRVNAAMNAVAARRSYCR